MFYNRAGLEMEVG